MISKSWQNLDSLFDEMNSDELKIKNNHCFCVNSAHNLIYITGAGYNKYYEEKFILITLQVSSLIICFSFTNCPLSLAKQIRVKLRLLKKG